MKHRSLRFRCMCTDESFFSLNEIEEMSIANVSPFSETCSGSHSVYSKFEIYSVYSRKDVHFRMWWRVSRDTLFPNRSSIPFDILRTGFHLFLQPLYYPLVMIGQNFSLLPYCNALKADWLLQVKATHLDGSS